MAINLVVALAPPPAPDASRPHSDRCGRAAHFSVLQQEVYMSDSHLYMAMDLIAGGNLGGSFRCDGEEQAAVIVRQIVRALRYLHDRHIAVSENQHAPGRRRKTPLYLWRGVGYVVALARRLQVLK